MDTLKKLLTATAGAVFTTLEAVSGVQAVTLESASLGPTGETGGFLIGYSPINSAAQFPGWKFQLDSTFQVTEIGGHLGIFGSSGTLFGAIVDLNNPSALPQGMPFLPEEVLAVTTFQPSYPSSDLRTPLSVTLNPGTYGLVFGAGLFGAIGGEFPQEGFIPANGLDLPGSTYFSYICCVIQPPLGGIWRNDTFLSNTRFVIEGNTVAVPEPSSGVSILALSVLGAGYMLKFKLKK